MPFNTVVNVDELSKENLAMLYAAGLVRVRCKYGKNKDSITVGEMINVVCNRFDESKKFKCNGKTDYVSCSQLSMITWSFYIVNREHLIEIK